FRSPALASSTIRLAMIPFAKSSASPRAARVISSATSRTRTERMESLAEGNCGRFHDQSLQGNTLWRAPRNAVHHSNFYCRIYRSFLDSCLQYSCAYFENSDVSLDDAQLAKKRHIAAKLLLRPGLKVLDIGSGWGGLGLDLAQNSKVSVVGINLS